MRQDLQDQMDSKKTFEPGDTVITFAGHAGVVMSSEEFAAVKTRFKEGYKAGRHFMPGCCPSPDYITQVPVFFEDGTYDVMRSMNLKKKTDLSRETRAKLRKMIGSGEEE